MPQQCNIDKINQILSELLDQLNGIPPSEKATVNNNEQPSEIQSKEKRPSLWVRIRERVKKLCMVKNKAANQTSDSGGSQGGSSIKSSQSIGEDQEDADLEIQKLQSDIRQMKTAFENLTRFQTQVSKSLESDFPSNNLKSILEKTDSIRYRSHDLRKIRRKIFILKCQIPSLLLKQSSRGLSITDSQTAEENGKINENGRDIYLPGLHVSEDFKNSSAFEEVVEKFQGLDFTQKLCLLSFAVFPENREVKKTMLMYWWIGEGFLFSDDSENSVTKILDEFSKKGLLEPIENERKLRPNSYKMEPHVHSAVIYLAKSTDLFDLYSSKGKLNMKKSAREKVCLVRGSSLLPQAKTSAMQPKTLQTVFNSSERYPDFTFKWFPFMDSLKVLYLGRWERTAKRHIEVESTEFLKNMKSLKNLRLASFQGISRIEKLENSICTLPKLVILDLRACYNLEVLPEDIGLLENLIYLDVSECFMLDGMPKGIAQLSRLQVLKGFVISQSDDERNCAIKHLVNLRKLSITVNKYLFTVEHLMESLKNLKRLESMKIAWGARFPEDDQRGEKSEATNLAEENRETTNEEKENQRDPATEKKKEREDEQLQKKGQTNDEKKGDVKETGKQEVGAEDGASSKKEDGNGDGRNEKANLEEEKKHDEVKAESLKSDKVVEGEKKTSPSQEETETIQNKPDDQTGKPNVEGDGDMGKADLEEGKKQDEVETDKSKSEKGVKGEKNASPPRESSDTIQKKQDDKSKVEKEGDGDKGKVDPEEGKKHDEVEAKSLKSDKVGEGNEKTSPPQESKDTIQNKTDDKTNVEKEGDGDKGKADPEAGKKHDEVEAGKSKSDKVMEGNEKTSPPQGSKDTIQNKTDDKPKVVKEGDGDKGKADPEEGKKHDEVEAGRSKSDKVMEGNKKTSPPQESKDTIQNKTDDKTKVVKEGDGDKGKVDPEEGKKHNEVEAKSLKSDNGVEGVKKANPSEESTDGIQKKPDDHQRSDKQEEKGDEKKEKVNLEEGKGKDEVKKSESSKPDKIIEGDEKTSPPQESKDTIQSKPDDYKENNQVQEKGDVQKNESDKTAKFGKKVSFSENSLAMIQKRTDDLKRDNAMAKEIQEKPSTSKPPKESGSRKTKLFMALGNETKKWGRIYQVTPAIDTSKLPSSLKKLELECFPDKNPPSWLNPKNLDNLEKLSIKGGKLSRISDENPTAENNCGVQILRLKYLHEFQAEWKDLQALFPEMILLEKYQCPKVAFCPTDGNGVWRSQP